MKKTAATRKVLKTSCNPKEKYEEMPPPTKPAINVKDKKLWKEIATFYKNKPITRELKNGKIISPNSLSSTLDNSFLDISSIINESDYIKFLDERKSIKYSGFNIELLLDQAADLIDRGIKDRSQWDDIAIKELNLRIEIQEYLALYKIHTLEEEKGFYSVDFKALAKEWEASRTLMGAMKNAIGDANHVSSLAVRMSADAGKEVQQYNFLMQKNLFDAANVEHCSRSEAILAKANWEEWNQYFKKFRADIAKQFIDLKAKIAMETDGVLNFEKRLNPLKERFKRDFYEAYMKLESITASPLSATNYIDKVYGYKKKLPVREDMSKPDFFDNILDWVRNAINYVISFSHGDQVLTISVPINEGYWDSNKKTLSYKFDIKESDFFQELNYLRIRGISLCAEDTHPKFLKGILRAKIKLPNGSIIQMGRISSRDSIRQPEIGGTNTLFNMNPIGKDWTIDLFAPNKSFQDEIEVDDLCLDIHVACQQTIN